MTNPDPAQTVVQALDRAPLLTTLDVQERSRLIALLEPLEQRDGQCVVAQDDASDGSMYLCVAGAALVSRSGLEVQRIGPGDHFGELALITGAPRAASVHALGRLQLLRLTRAGYEQLHAQAPSAGRKLLEAITASLAGRLTEVSDSVRTLLRARSLPRRTLIDVLACGQQRRVHPGTPIAALLPREQRGELVVAGLVDRAPVSLATPIGSSCTVDPLTTEHWEGQRIYRLSLGLLLLEAAHRLAPAARVRLQHSVGFGQHVRVEARALPQLEAELEGEMRRLQRAQTPLLEELWTVQEARELFAERGREDEALLLATWREPAVPLVSYGQRYALGLIPLVSDASLLGEFGITHDDRGLLLLYGERSASSPPPPASAPAAERPGAGTARAISAQNRAMTQSQERFLTALSVTSVGAFNRVCVDGKVTELIRVHEGFHEKAIGQIADAIAARRETLKLVCVAGPSSSGKTTFIRRLRVQLQVNGVRPIGLSLDDYYKDREQTPRDSSGARDFEALEAIDLQLLGEQLAQLLSGAAVRAARYDFRVGKRSAVASDELRLGPDDMLLLEGLHGLNPAVVAGIPSERVFRIFICPLTHLPFDDLNRAHASDVRLLRRIVRDRHQRATAAEDNILRWPSVRAGERRHIFPFQHHADAVFDSSLAYEPAVLKVYAERYLLEVPREGAAFATAYRLLRLLDRFVAIYPDQVPPTSILREFIGGSGFEY